MTFSQAKPYDIPSCKPGFQVRDQYFAELRPKNIFKTLSWTVPSVNWCRISSLFDQTSHPSRRRCGACWSSFFHPLGTPNRSSTHLLKVIVFLIQTLLNPNSAGYRCSGGTFPNAMQIQIPQTEGGNGAPVASQNYPTTWFAVIRIRNPTNFSNEISSLEVSNKARKNWEASIMYQHALHPKISALASKKWLTNLSSHQRPFWNKIHGDCQTHFLQHSLRLAEG